MGDVIFKGFQCLNSKCQHFIFIKKDDIGDPFEIICPKCDYTIKSGEVTKFFDYELMDKKLGKILRKRRIFNPS